MHFGDEWCRNSSFFLTIFVWQRSRWDIVFCLWKLRAFSKVRWIIEVFPRWDGLKRIFSIKSLGRYSKFPRISKFPGLKLQGVPKTSIQTSSRILQKLSKISNHDFILCLLEIIRINIFSVYCVYVLESLVSMGCETHTRIKNDPIVMCWMLILCRFCVHEAIVSSLCLHLAFVSKICWFINEMSKRKWIFIIGSIQFTLALKGNNC